MMDVDETQQNPRADKGLYATVVSAVERLYAGISASDTRAESASKAALATLRRGAGKDPEDDLVAWMQVMELVVPEIEPKYLGKRERPSQSENAIYTALVFYALHQQGREKNMHTRNQTFAQAAGVLAHRRDSVSTKGRFDSLLTAKTRKARDYYIRNLISLLRAEEIPFNYGALASDLRALESAQHRKGVLLRWGRDFSFGYSVSKYGKDSKETTNPEETK
ncbi:type I-E CRISPR-associated protein Cse2/CasB [Gleimia hominis]|uniref:type I-E CRISPR-associated protein Cse2/CasB n=1 Tax=Gleimia hominis TaxID=595468 RepID=UPI000C7FAC09|nr:type I-E CRISPR-associated protein Cse2/CasB [Gleimia hominis]WIK64366.1 type I-E CRISPR-associated protein Cse2/CasB [Gleimia hominis]